MTEPPLTKPSHSTPDRMRALYSHMGLLVLCQIFVEASHGKAGHTEVQRCKMASFMLQGLSYYKGLQTQQSLPTIPDIGLLFCHVARFHM